jgi:hypothetical protein
MVADSSFAVRTKNHLVTGDSDSALMRIGGSRAHSFLFFYLSVDGPLEDREIRRDRLKVYPIDGSSLERSSLAWGGSRYANSREPGERAVQLEYPFFGHNFLLGRYFNVDSNKKQDNANCLTARSLQT